MQIEQELLEQFKKENINAYRINDFIQIENKIRLDGIEELIRFVHNNNINNIFYFYYHLNGCELLIDEEVIRKFHLDKEMLILLQDEIMEYNTKILGLNFDKPVGLIIYCIYNGMVLEVEENNCIVGQDIDTPENACKMLIEKHLEEIEQHKKEKLDSIQKQRKELSEKILNDKEFQKSTNVSLRRVYSDIVIRNNPDYKKLFLSERGEWYDIPINDFIEILWREYKEISKPPIITEFLYKK